MLIVRQTEHPIHKVLWSCGHIATAVIFCLAVEGKSFEWVQNAQFDENGELVDWLKRLAAGQPCGSPPLL
jgi:hypothetical protein